MPSLIAMLALQVVVLALIYVVSPYPVPMIIAVILWGGLNFAIGTPIQSRILGWTADASNLASSLIPSGFNLGIALSSSLAAALLNAGYGYRILPLVGAFAMLVAVAAAVASYTAEKRRGIAPPLPAAAE
jgi:DHA1 family inner membrane transport protein